MKMIKRLIAVVVVLVVLVVGGAIAAVVYIDSIAKAAVEKGGTYALGVPTKLQKADVGLMSAHVGLKGLDVGNPQGYKSASFMKMGDGEVGVSASTLNKDVVELPELKLSDILVNLEKSGGKANYQVIIDNLKRFESGSAKPAEPSTGKEKKFIVKVIDINNVKVHLDLIPEGGSLTQFDMTLDNVHLTDVGTAGKGVPMGELVSIVFKAIMSAAVNKGGGLPGDLLNDLTGQLSGLKSLDQLGVKLTENIKGQVDAASKEVGKKVDDAKKDVEKKVDDAKKKAEDALKGIIPGGKK